MADWAKAEEEIEKNARGTSSTGGTKATATDGDREDKRTAATKARAAKKKKAEE